MIFDGDKYRPQREEMVKRQIEARGIRDSRVLSAMRDVPRELFAGEDQLERAFFDGPLSIGHGQTISQPYIVAYMTEQLELSPQDRVLEIGTGCGYQTAVLAELASHVYTVEIIEPLAEMARKKLKEAGYGNISFRISNGTVGWKEEAPFDAVIVTAAPVRLPGELMRQLADGGRMIVPVGGFSQVLYKVTRRGDDYDREKLIGVRFVPMTGRIESDS
jgi:protein-L-isoaspartate(D-aspartate) O-methyltransferase